MRLVRGSQGCVRRLFRLNVTTQQCASKIRACSADDVKDDPCCSCCCQRQPTRPPYPSAWINDAYLTCLLD